MISYTDRRPDISIVMPCLDERSTVGLCIEDAKKYIKGRGLQGEIIVVDNGSTDGSADEAKKHGAKVLRVPRKGYGRALRAGISRAEGDVIVFADCDTTYDLLDLDKFYYPLKAGKYDIIIGDRLSGGIEKGAMPLLHIPGVKFLSLCGRKAFCTDVRDFHCGLRSITRKAARKMRLRAKGMEFATEFIAEAAEKGLRIGQCPITLRRCTKKRRSKLRTFRDGMRHLWFIISRYMLIRIISKHH